MAAPDSSHSLGSYKEHCCISVPASMTFRLPLALHAPKRNEPHDRLLCGQVDMRLEPSIKACSQGVLQAAQQQCPDQASHEMADAAAVYHCQGLRRTVTHRKGSRKVMFPAFSWKNRMVGRCRLVARLQPIGCRYHACSFVPSLAVRSTSCTYSNMTSCPRLPAVCS